MTEQFAAVEYAENRTPDYQYQELLKRIKNTGRAALSGMDEGSRRSRPQLLSFDLSNGFPLITERDLTRGTSQNIIDNYESNVAARPLAGPVKQGVGEILAFINGARTQEELEAFGCKFWEPWTSDAAKAEKRGLELGDLGPGSYGAAFHDFPTANGSNFDQYEAMIAQIKDRPELRTHLITPFIPDLITRAPGHQQKVLVVPCHGLQHYLIDPESKEISMTHFQRSADVPVGLPFNFAHYAALLMMVGQVTGYKPSHLDFAISDPHYYNRHEALVDELISREPYPFPKVTIDPDVKNIQDFRTEHFKIEDYQAHPPINVGGTAV
jgi:thymidylate synthase